MQTILIVIHIIIALLLIITILLQRTSSDGLEGLGSSSGNIMSPISSANFLTKVTAILATFFVLNCLVLANLAANNSKKTIVDKVVKSENDNLKTQKNLPIAE